MTVCRRVRQHHGRTIVVLREGLADSARGMAGQEQGLGVLADGETIVNQALSFNTRTVEVKARSTCVHDRNPVRQFVHRQE